MNSVQKMSPQFKHFRDLVSVLYTSEEGYEMLELNVACEELLGRTIPWDNLGYKSFEEFIVNAKIAGYVTARWVRGELRIYDVPRKGSENLYNFNEKRWRY